MDLGIVGNKKKLKRYSVFAIIEGQKREKAFLECLKEIYLDENITLKLSPKFGGNPDILLNDAIRQLSFDFKRIFVWCDEDTDINDKSRANLFKSVSEKLDIWIILPIFV